MQLKRTLVLLFILPTCKLKLNVAIYLKICLFKKMSIVENLIDNNNSNYNTNLIQQNLSPMKLLSSFIGEASGCDLQVRVIIVGDTTVGKTSLLRLIFTECYQKEKINRSISSGV